MAKIADTEGAMLPARGMAVENAEEVQAVLDILLKFSSSSPAAVAPTDRGNEENTASAPQSVDEIEIQEAGSSSVPSLNEEEQGDGSDSFAEEDEN